MSKNAVVCRTGSFAGQAGAESTELPAGYFTAEDVSKYDVIVFV